MTKANGNGPFNGHDRGKLSPLPQTNGVGSLSVVPLMGVKPPYEALEDRQNVFELKLISLAQELTRYREHSSQEMATKNKEISALRQKLREVEHNASKKNTIVTTGSTTSQANGPNKTQPLVPNGVADRPVPPGLDDDQGSHKKCREDMHQLLIEFQKVKSDLGELMVVYDDLQDRFHEIDRSWRCNLVFVGIKVDPHGMFENSECLESKIRNIIRNKLNISREIIIQRCQRVFNGSDQKNNRPIVVNFQKWSDKEEILRKSKILKNAGIVVEEDFSRAAKNRRKELEKLIKEVKAVDPNKKCVLRYDKLIIDDHIYIYNENEKRVQRLPFTYSGNPSILDDDPNELILSGIGGRHRPKTCPVISPSKTRRAVSVESILDRIPGVTMSIGGGSLEDTNQFRRSTLTSAKSSPSVHQLGLGEHEGKMVPNFALATGVVPDNQFCIQEESEDNGPGRKSVDDDGDQSSDFNQADLELSKQVRSIRDKEGIVNDEDQHDGNSSSSDPEEIFAKPGSLANPLTNPSSLAQKGSNTLIGQAKDAAESDSDDEDESGTLPLNHVINFDEWNNTGTYIPPTLRNRAMSSRKSKNGSTNHNTSSYNNPVSEISSKPTPRLKAKFRKGNNDSNKISRSRGKRKGP